LANAAIRGERYKKKTVLVKAISPKRFVSFAIDRLRGGKNGSDAGMKLLVALRVAMRREGEVGRMDLSIMKNRLELSN